MFIEGLEIPLIDLKNSFFSFLLSILSETYIILYFFTELFYLLIPCNIKKYKRNSY
jgi:hypothetical protein